MNEKVNKFIHSRMFVIILIGILIITTVLIGTYAWFTWSSTDNTTLTMTIGKLADVSFTNGNAIDGNLNPVFYYSDGLSTSFSITNRNTSDTSIGYEIKFNITSIDQELINNSSDIKYVVLINNNIIKEGNLSGASNNTSITLYNGNLNSGTSNYVIYLYIDGNEENDSSMMNKSIVGNIMVEGGGALLTGAALHITNLYLDNKDTNPVVNNGISYGYASIYDKDTDPDTSGGLMNDRHGSMSTGIDVGNIRYYGANPSNYIYFNCSDYNNQSSSTCETWRIIGVFDGKIKIMRNSPIGELSWDQDKNQDFSLTTYNNDWSNSSLQQFLNGKYYNRGNTSSLIYYSDSTGSTETNLNLVNIGIKNDDTRRLISETLWYLKGWDSTSIYSDQMYDYERNSGEVNITGQSTTLLRNIGIPYASDYGYAVDFGSCSAVLFNYDDTTCTSTNWMKPILGSGWLMAPVSGGSFYAWYVRSSGFVNYGYNVYRALGVAPVLHLNSELGIKTGDGSQDTPYQIAIG